MSFLSRNEFIQLINSDSPLVENMIDPEVQIQPNGIELTVDEILSPLEGGSIDFTNEERKVPECYPLHFNEDGWVVLSPGVYKILFNETIRMPNDLLAFAEPRSSLIRSGVLMGTAIWDAGYVGRSECSLVVKNPYGFRVKKNARIVQLMFTRLETEVKDGYSGRYMHENM